MFYIDNEKNQDHEDKINQLRLKLEEMRDQYTKEIQTL